MSHDPNVPQYRPQQPQPPTYGSHPQQPYPVYGQPHPPQFQQDYNPQRFGPSGPQPVQAHPRPKPTKGTYGVSSWIVGSLLAISILIYSGLGEAEAILIILGIAALLTGIYSLIFKRRSWAALPNGKFAVAAAVAGATSLVIGGITASVSSYREAPAAVHPMTSAKLEADAAARLKSREEALVKSEADSAAKLAAREDAVKKAEAAVKAREDAIGAAEAQAAASMIREGIWTVGIDIAPGTYRTTRELTSYCYWAITRTGSNGGDIIENDGPEGGFPMVTLSEGQTFETSRCGTWSKQ